MPRSILVTGATGFVGSHVAEACLARGDRVSTIARTESDTALMEKLGVAIHRGDLVDAETIRRAVEGVDAVIHCAAKVGDWGPVQDYRRVNVDALRHMLEACRSDRLTRFVHMSSLGVYEARHHHGTDETEPLPVRHMDGYTQTKVEAEHLVQDAHRLHGLPVVVLRPGFVYGPRDRTVLPRLVDKLRQGVVQYLGDGRQAMNTIYVGNLVDAVVLALDKPNAVGQIYNLTDGEYVSKRRFFEVIADRLAVPRPTKSKPLWLAKLAARIMEWRARRRRSPVPPRITRATVKFLGLNLDFSVEKAKRDLGYAPRVGFDEGMRMTLDWFQKEQRP